MSTPSEIVAILELLSEYYNRTLTKPQVRIYVRQLKDLDPHQLEKAAYAWIDRSPFFPRISELRDTAAVIKSPQQDLMYLEAQSLKREFFISHTLDTGKWKNLIQRLTRSGRLEYANHLRCTLSRLQTEYDQYGNLKPEFKEKFHSAWSLGQTP
jgi:hypothetical protein